LFPDCRNWYRSVENWAAINDENKSNRPLIIDQRDYNLDHGLMHEKLIEYFRARRHAASAFEPRRAG
jgi:hypothetical protein